MGKYMALYKCQMCGEMQRLSQTAEGSFEDIEHLTAKILSQHIHFGSRPDLLNIQEKIPHKCRDGSLGISLFAGFKKIQ